MLSTDDTTRELEPAAPEGTDPTEDYKTEITQLKKKMTDLTILIYQVLEQDEADFFDDNVRTIERQNIRRILKSRFPLTPEMLEIVNKAKEQSKQNSISQ